VHDNFEFVDNSGRRYRYRLDGTTIHYEWYDGYSWQPDTADDHGKHDLARKLFEDLRKATADQGLLRNA